MVRYAGGYIFPPICIPAMYQMDTKTSIGFRNVVSLASKHGVIFKVSMLSFSGAMYFVLLSGKI